MELPTLVEELSDIGLTDTLKKYYNEPVEHEAKSIVAGPRLHAIPKQIIQDSNRQQETYYSLNRIIMISSSCSH